MRFSPQTAGNSFPDVINSHIVAPFWSNNDIRSSGMVRYEVHNGSSAASRDLLSTTGEVIANTTGETFQGVWMLLVEWRDCHPHPHGQVGLSTNSFLQKVPHIKVGRVHAHNSYSHYLNSCNSS